METLLCQTVCGSGFCFESENDLNLTFLLSFLSSFPVNFLEHVSSDDMGKISSGEWFSLGVFCLLQASLLPCLQEGEHLALGSSAWCSCA